MHLNTYIYIYKYMFIKMPPVYSAPGYLRQTLCAFVAAQPTATRYPTHRQWIQAEKIRLRPRGGGQATYMRISAYIYTYNESEQQTCLCCYVYFIFNNRMRTADPITRTCNNEIGRAAPLYSVRRRPPSLMYT